MGPSKAAPTPICAGEAQKGWRRLDSTSIRSEASCRSWSNAAGDRLQDHALDDPTSSTRPSCAPLRLRSPDALPNVHRAGRRSLFDSAAYVLFARDDRLLTPEGTVRLKEIEHWPATTEVVNGRTVAEVRALPKADRERLLSLVNLEWTMAELERCRQAVRDGTIWDMARRRSHVHPDLRSAWRFVEDLVAGRVDEPGWEVARRWLLDAQPRRGQGGQRWWGEDSTVDPLIVSEIGPRPKVDPRRAL